MTKLLLVSACVLAGISFGEVGGCGLFIEKTIEVTCDGDAH